MNIFITLKHIKTNCQRTALCKNVPIMINIGIFQVGFTPTFAEVQTSGYSNTWSFNTHRRCVTCGVSILTVDV